MRSITAFLSKFSKLKPTKRIVKGFFLEAVMEYDIPIKESEVTINSGVIYLKTNQIVKSEVFINKEKIITHINKKLGGDKIKDVR